LFSGKGKEARSSLAAAAGRVTVGTRSLKKSNRAKPKKRQAPDFDKPGKQEADMRKQSVFERSMPSDLIRGWRPIRVKKTRQNKRLVRAVMQQWN
jgi:hypothetical protein